MWEFYLSLPPGNRHFCKKYWQLLSYLHVWGNSINKIKWYRSEGVRASSSEATFGEPFDWRQAVASCHRSMTSHQYFVRNTLFGEFLLQSEESTQQGYPIVSSLFCVYIMYLVRNWHQSWTVGIWMTAKSVDNSMICFTISISVRRFGPTLGLQLMRTNVELSPTMKDVTSSFRAVMPNIPLQWRNTILGAPIGDISAIDTVLTKNWPTFNALPVVFQPPVVMMRCFFLLKNCFGMHKLLHILQSAPCYQSSSLTQYDTVIRQTLYNSS